MFSPSSARLAISSKATSFPFNKIVTSLSSATVILPIVLVISPSFIPVTTGADLSILTSTSVIFPASSVTVITYLPSKDKVIPSSKLSSSPSLVTTTSKFSSAKDNITSPLT